MADDSTGEPIGVVRTVWVEDAEPLDLPFESAAEAVRLVAGRCADATTPGTDGKPTMWNTELIRRPDGRQLYIGWSDQGWLLLDERAAPLAERVPFARRAAGTVVFDLGQWTELDRPYLVDGDGCRSLLSAWLGVTGDGREPSR